MGILKKHIYTLTLLFGTILPSAAQELSSHILNELITAGKKNPYQGIDAKNFAIITIDSIPFSNTPQHSTAYLDFKKRSVVETTFKRGGGRWNYSNGKAYAIGKEAYDEFPDFILQFSQNKDFQINHTIFPFPVNVFVGKEQAKRKLIMPRDWDPVELTNLYPQMIHFKSDEKGNNRKIYIYQKGRMASMYNFIRINKNWYMIEKFEFE